MRKTSVALVLFASALACGGAGRLAAAPAPGEPRVVEIVAKRFEFSPKELTLKKGEPVTLRFRTEDVTHGFLLRPLRIDLDIEPGKPTDVTVTPANAGTFTAICNHFCGAGHGGMKLKVSIVE